MAATDQDDLIGDVCEDTARAFIVTRANIDNRFCQG
jgi:hypothetical protein